MLTSFALPTKQWIVRQKLQLSTRKITAMILRGKLDSRRQPHVRFTWSDGSLRLVQHLRYLGVTLQSNLKIDMHVQEVSGKAKTLFQTLVWLERQNWDYAAVNYDVLHKSLYQQDCAYTAHWLGKGALSKTQEKGPGRRKTSPNEDNWRIRHRINSVLTSRCWSPAHWPVPHPLIEHKAQSAYPLGGTTSWSRHVRGVGRKYGRKEHDGHASTRKMADKMGHWKSRPTYN